MSVSNDIFSSEILEIGPWPIIIKITVKIFLRHVTRCGLRRRKQPMCWGRLCRLWKHKFVFYFSK